VPHALGATRNGALAAAAPNALTFVQISDTHIGFRKEANPDVVGSLRRAIADINALPQTPAFVVHTGDVSHLSKPEEFGQAREVLQEIRADRVHTIPGEHDTIDDGVTGYLNFFDHDRNGKAWYSFDQGGVHFVGMVNVLTFETAKAGGFGAEQLEWLEKDLKGRSASTPIVIFTHVPMWPSYPQWGWATEDAPQALSYLKRFGSVTVLNGHIHQVVQKVEGNVSYQTAFSTAFPQPAAGQGPAPGPMKVPADKLRSVLGIREIVMAPPKGVALTDVTLA
jgi:3',5'-cyclic AMP phosphodiesterase CpdA